jgi:hypothetical protein
VQRVLKDEVPGSNNSSSSSSDISIVALVRLRCTSYSNSTISSRNSSSAKLKLVATGCYGSFLYIELMRQCSAAT